MTASTRVAQSTTAEARRAALSVEDSSARTTQSASRETARTTFDVVIPVYNKRELLPQALGSVLAAARTHGDVTVWLMDNGSTDGSFEFLQSLAGDRVIVRRVPGVTIGALRNAGAVVGSADIVSFIDCDCLVPLDLFAALDSVFRRTGAAAAGRRIVLPPTPTWVEATWDQMHQDGRDGERTWINSANLAIRRDVFERACGFDESLETGEDAELCQRIRNAGGRIMQDQQLAVAHLDNAKTLGAFYRKERWRGMGMFGTVSLTSLDRPTVMTFSHLALVCAALWVAFGAHVAIGTRLVAAIALVFAVPAATVAYRRASSIGVFSVVRATILYELYFLARVNAVFILVLRRLRSRMRS